MCVNYIRLICLFTLPNAQLAAQYEFVGKALKFDPH